MNGHVCIKIWNCEKDIQDILFVKVKNMTKMSDVEFIHFDNGDVDNSLKQSENIPDNNR